MFLKYYSNYQSRIIAVSLFIASFLLWLIPVNMLLGQPFSLPIYFITFFMMWIWLFAAQYVLQQFFCPVLQVNRKDIVVSLVFRKVLPLAKIKSLSFHSERVEIHYVEDNLSKEFNFKVREAKRKVSIKNGQFYYL